MHRGTLVAEDRNAVILEAEREILGLSHDEIGAFLCKYWEFPDLLVEAVRHHHAPIAYLESMERHEPLCRYVNIACRLASIPIDAEFINVLAKDHKEFLGFYDLDVSTLFQLSSRVQNDISQLMTGLALFT